MSKIHLGNSSTGESVYIDIPTLISTRLLVTASSGGGKSETLRRKKRIAGLHIGRKFGRLTVISDNEWTPRGHRIARVVCDCGAQKEVLFSSLQTGNTKSCGCLSRKEKRERMTTHGHAGRPEYQAWADMWQRCTNSHCRNYKNYGGRGICVCERWKEFPSFLADVGDRPSARHSLERLDVNGNYEPINCTWATLSEQNFNRRSTRQYRGVRPSRHDGKRFESRIIKDRRTYHLGTFDTPQEAARAYDAKALELYGPRAFQNFPTPDFAMAVRS